MADLWMQIHAYFSQNTTEYLAYLWQHVSISLLSLAVSCLIGIPLGYLCTRNRLLNRCITGIFQVLRIIPSLAILILLIPVIGTGVAPSITALVLLSVPPILMNTTVGFAGVPAFMNETACALGMTESQQFWRVQVPLALPKILTGMKIAMVEIIASATLAAKIGAGGLGSLILTGIGLFRTDLLLIGGVSVSLLAILSGLMFQLLSRWLFPYQPAKNK